MGVGGKMLHERTLSVTLHLSTILLCQHQLSPSVTPDHDHQFCRPQLSLFIAVTIILVCPFHCRYHCCSPFLFNAVASVRHCNFAPALSPCSPLVHDSRCSTLLRRSHLPRQLCFCNGRFTGSVHCHHGRKHDSVQVDMVLEKELRVLYLDLKVAWRD